MSGQGTAIIGAGFMGPAHAEALRRIGVSVVGILGVSQEESSGAAAKLGIPKAYSSLDELLGDPEVGVVHITTPNKFHHAHAKAAILAGKHVLCEKPLAMDSTESADLVRLAKASGKVCGVNYNMRFYPLCIDARERVRGGEYGRVHSVQGTYCQDWLLLETDYNWRLLPGEGGALRAVADVGTHWMDLVTSVTGLEVEAVFADLNTVHPVRQRPLGEVQTYTTVEAEREPIAIETEDQAAVLFRFKNGARGSLWVSQVTAGRKNRLTFELGAADAAVAWDSESPNQIWIGHRERPNEVMLKDPSLLSPMAKAHANYPGGHNEGYPDSFKQSFRAFYGAIRGESGLAPYATFEDGHKEVVLCEAILQSSRESRWVTL